MDQLLTTITTLTILTVGLCYLSLWLIPMQPRFTESGMVIRRGRQFVRWDRSWTIMMDVLLDSTRVHNKLVFTTVRGTKPWTVAGNRGDLFIGFALGESPVLLLYGKSDVTDSFGAWLTGAVALPIGQWVNVAVSYEKKSSVVRFYVNATLDDKSGVPVKRVAYSGRWRNSRVPDTYIPRVGGFSGVYRDPYIAGEALSTTEIATLVKTRGANL